ncbi:MAG: glycosyltransferase family 2 protein, partial [Beijerinckiaceae bacterium]
SRLPSASAPRLTVGMPVYNGAATLEAAIRSVLDQTLTDLEVVISDNQSTDATPEICRRLAAEDGRIRYVRQPAALSPTDNFRFVLDAARAPFFMWAAHDDTRDLDLCEKLVAALEHDAAAVLAFGDLLQVENGDARPHALDFATTGVPAGARLRMNAWRQLHHLYGVWRTGALRRIDWKHVDWWHDTPLMMAASLTGDFIHVPGPRFIYLYNPRPFFGWRRKQASPSLAGDVREFAVRTRELLRLVLLTYGTVARIGGPLRGIEATAYVALKVAGQILGFVWRRLPFVRPRG